MIARTRRRRPRAWLGGCRPALAAWALVCAAAAAAAEPAVYDLVPEFSFVHFEVLHFGTSTLRGRFGPLTGFVRLDRAAQSGEVGLRIDVGSVATGVRALDRRLREPDLLAVEEYPQAWFVARRFVFDGARPAQVHGELTLRGRSVSLTLVADRFGCRVDAGGEVCGGDFHAELRRSEIGATLALPFVADTVRLLVEVEGRRR